MKAALVSSVEYGDGSSEACHGFECVWWGVVSSPLTFSRTIFGGRNVLTEYLES